MTKIIKLTESFQQVLTEARIDKENNIIRDVCLLNPVSENGTYYAPEVMERAIPLFEGSKVFADHPRRSERGEVRGVRDIIGKNINVRMTNNKLKADLNVLESHKGWVFPLAIQAPDLVGLSINAQGKVFQKDGKNIVEEIVQVWSVDMVSEPAATSNLFEQMEFNIKEEETMIDWKKVTVKDLEENCPKIVKDLTESILKKIGEEGDVKKLQESLDKLKKENEALKLKDDEHEVREALQKKAETRDKLLKEAKLPETAVTELFKKQLLAVEEETVDGKKQTVEEGMKKLIEDRKTVALANSGKITGAGDEKKFSKITEGDEGDEDKELEESKEKVSDNKIIKAVKGPKPSNVLNL